MFSPLPGSYCAVSPVHRGLIAGLECAEPEAGSVSSTNPSSTAVRWRIRTFPHLPFRSEFAVWHLSCLRRWVLRVATTRGGPRAARGPGPFLGTTVRLPELRGPLSIPGLTHGPVRFRARERRKTTKKAPSVDITCSGYWLLDQCAGVLFLH